MFNKEDHIMPEADHARSRFVAANSPRRATTSTESGLTTYGNRTYCDQIIVAILLAIILAVPLFFDVHLYSTFDLSKITILYILTFTLIAVLAIKTMIIYLRNGNRTNFISFHIRQPLSMPTTLSVAIAAFLFITGLATIFSINPYLSLMGTYKRYDGFVSTLVYVFLFYVVVSFIERKRLNSLLNVIILTACIASIYGVLQHFGLDPYHWNVSSELRVFSTFGHPAFFSAFLIMVLPLVLVKIFSYPEPLWSRACKAELSSRRRSTELSRGQGKFKTCIFMAVLALLTVTFYYTRTRASFLGFIVSSLFFFSLIGKNNLLRDKTKTIITIAILIGIFVLSNINGSTSVIGRFIQDIKPALNQNGTGPVLRNTTKGVQAEDESSPVTRRYRASPSERVIRAGEATKSSHSKSAQADLPRARLVEGDIGFTSQLKGTIFMRVFQYLTGLRIIYDYPILGIGLDTLGMIYSQYLAKVYEETDEYRHYENQNRIHNDFLDMTVSRGLLGLGVYLWFIFAYSRMVWSTLRSKAIAEDGKGCKKTEGTDKVLIIGLCSGCLAYFIQNQFSFGHVPIITLFWFLVAMSVIACLRASHRQASSEPKRSGAGSGRSTELSRGLENPSTEGTTCKAELSSRRTSFRPYTALVQGRRVRSYFVFVTSIITICLMILLITLCLFRYKADVYFDHGRTILHKASTDPEPERFRTGSGDNSLIDAIKSYEMAIKYNPLEASYRNLLNDTYMKMVSARLHASHRQAGLNKSKDIDSLLDYPSDRVIQAGKNQPVMPEAASTSARRDSLQRNFFIKRQTAMLLTNVIAGAKEVQKLYPRDYRSAFILGQAYHVIDNQPGFALAGMTNKDMQEEAIKYYKQAIMLQPFKFEFRGKLAQLYFEKGYYEDAIHELREAIDIAPNNHVLYLNLANIFVNLGKYEDAEKLCNHILELAEPENEEYNDYAKRMLETLLKTQALNRSGTGQAKETINLRELSSALPDKKEKGIQSD